MAGEKETTVQDYVNQTVQRGDAPAPEVQTNRGVSAGLGGQAPQGGQAGQKRKRIYVKVRYYVGAVTSLTFYIPTKDGMVKERVEVSDQQWPVEIINYLKTKGKHRTRTTWGFSSLLHMRVKYTADEWAAKIPAKKLLNMIKASKTWTRSGHATKIVELLEQVVGHEWGEG
jgi:hypothetical protein